MCGKDKSVTSRLISASGSPPHVRERRSMRRWILNAVGITPACAGKTMSSSPCLEYTRDHPRMCGKDQLKVRPLLIPTGSPPHVRERPCSDPTILTRPRITPACAGKTQAYQQHSRYYQDHPRMCGKDISADREQRGIGGSPPHVRERPGKKESLYFEIGITPACAGKTADRHDQCVVLQDHPRMCGKDAHLSAS